VPGLGDDPEIEMRQRRVLTAAVRKYRRRFDSAGPRGPKDDVAGRVARQLGVRPERFSLAAGRLDSMRQHELFAEYDHVVGVQLGPRTQIFRIGAQFSVFVFKRP